MSDMVDALNTIRRYDAAARRDYVSWWMGAIAEAEYSAHPSSLYPEDEVYE